MTAPDFKSHLDRQLSFLARSCGAFDEGYHDEAIRIATVVRVLVHQTKNSTSLLKHLNATTIDLLNTCAPIDKNTIIANGMGTLQLSTDDGWSYFPTLGDGLVNTFVPVSKWWDQEIMVRHPIRLTRRKVVLAAANQDGGAHVDEQLNADYEALKTAGFAGMVTHTGLAGTTVTQLEGSHYVCLRQIGYELLNSHALLARSAG